MNDDPLIVLYHWRVVLKVIQGFLLNPFCVGFLVLVLAPSTLPLPAPQSDLPATFPFRALGRALSIRQSEAEDLRKNGIPLYRLSSLRNSKTFLELPKIKMLSGRTKLYVGNLSFNATGVAPIPSAECRADIPDLAT